MTSPIIFLLLLVGLILAVVCTVLVIGYVMVPLFRGVGNTITAVFKGIGFIIRHIASWVGGTLTDLVRMVGAVIAAIVLLPIMLVSVLIGRWSAASHYAASVVAESRIAGLCLYRALLRRPLTLLFLDGLVEGLEQRIPVAMENAPATDLPRRGAPSFDGYTIVGSLRAGGSGAKLHVAEPDDALRRRRPDLPRQVVIKSFAISEGSALPQIVRESRALDAARQLGLVFDHGIDANRFFYVMPYHPGDNLGVVARRLHGESTGEGLDGRGLRQATSLVTDLVDTLVVYHSGGLWHKDVKPDNIIVHDGKAHVVDLGLVTPLRSAMTLTTHGTEYFRDPEMVRMALRGVKVHQVDGAKFDIYAAGAVLYFVLENTFPAHGGLSSFAKRSPEALRWIVRRAMADYSKRYERADAMLADLRHVLESNDPYAIRPAQLPSMRGETDPAFAGGAGGHDGYGGHGGHREFNAPPPPPPGTFTSRPVPPASPAWSPAAAKASESIAKGLAAGAAAIGLGGAAVATAATGPALRVTNWWSGTYEPAIAGGPLPRGLSAREQREAIKERARAAAIAASTAVRRPRDPSPALIVLTVAMIGAIIAGALIVAPLLLTGARPKSIAADVQRGVRDGLARGSAGAVSVSVATGVPVIPGVDVLGTDGAPIPATVPMSDGRSDAESSAVALGTLRMPKRLLLVNLHPDPSAPEIIDVIESTVAALAAEGITVAVDDTESAAEVIPSLIYWSRNVEGGRSVLERALLGHEYGGVLWVSVDNEVRRDDGTRPPKLEIVISSKLPPALARPLIRTIDAAVVSEVSDRYAFHAVDGTAIETPLDRFLRANRMLVISTVPVNTRSVDQAVASIDRDFAALGIETIHDDTEAAADLVQQLPLWRDGVVRGGTASDAARVGIAAKLETHGYDGVIWVHPDRAADGTSNHDDGAVKTGITIIMRDPSEHAPAGASPDASAEASNFTEMRGRALRLDLAVAARHAA